MLALTCAVALAYPRNGRGGPEVTVMLTPGRVLPANEVPQPELLIFAPVGKERALALNAAVAFVTSAKIPARPFVFAGSIESRERAVDCLAAAMLFEAGDDPGGQRAVAQVIVNRARHPAFPATVCGVVFQGSERRTGCQFTFTCDGALARVQTRKSWDAARLRASTVLDGQVDQAVGTATHYHTDWVWPVWSDSLDKIAQVGTHLFYRWHGRWGDPSALLRNGLAPEPAMAQLARLSPAHAAGLAASLAGLPPPLDADAGTATDAASAASMAVATAPHAVPGKHEAVLEFAVSPGGNGAAYAMKALDLCGDKVFCKAIGRLNPGDTNTPVRFLYVRDRRTGVDQAYWDCETFRRNNPGQCLSATNRVWITFDGNLAR